MSAQTKSARDAPGCGSWSDDGDDATGRGVLHRCSTVGTLTGIEAAATQDESSAPTAGRLDPAQWWAHLVACRPKLAEVRLRATRFGGQPSRDSGATAGRISRSPRINTSPTILRKRDRGFARGGRDVAKCWRSSGA